MSLLDEVREAATDSARKLSDGRDVSTVNLEAIVEIVVASLRPLTEAIATLANATLWLEANGSRSLKRLQEIASSATPVAAESEELLAARVRPLAAILILSFGFTECQKFARNNGGADPGRYLPHPIAFDDAAMMIASDLLQRVNHAKLLRALIDERPRREKELRKAMPWVTDAELAAFPARRCAVQR